MQSTIRLLLASVCLCASLSWGQGSLIPSGPPGPTMKSLDQLGQMEPRTPITNLPYTISQPGSYYVATNLTGESGSDGISIQADNVTIDLMGFTLNGVAGTLSGIGTGGDQRNISVRNGTIVGWGDHGIGLNQTENVRLTELTVENSGGDGFYVGGHSFVEKCVSLGNGDDGFSTDREASQFVNCHSISNHYGFYLDNGSACQLKECSAVGSKTGAGFYLPTGSTIEKSIARDNNANGIQAADHCTVTGNECRNNGLDGTSAGISAAGSGGIIRDNQITGNRRGLYILNDKNVVADNVVKENTDNYDLAPGNQVNLLLCEVPETIDWSCSIKLAGSLTCSDTTTNGITVSADDVTIDMDGHSLVGPGDSSLHGIYQAESLRNLTISNGKLVGWQGSFKGGINALGSSSRISGIQAATNYYGIVTGKNSVLTDCATQDNANYGINAGEGNTLSGCTAIRNATCGIVVAQGGAISRCTASYNSSDGIVSLSSRVSDCTAYANGSDGINGDDSNISGCTALLNSGDGIKVLWDSRVIYCNANDNGYIGDGAGIHALYRGNLIDGNHVTTNDRGIDVDDISNTIVRNSASGNTVNWNVVAGNVCLVVQASTNIASIIGNSGGVDPGSSNPNVNFTIP